MLLAAGLGSRFGGVKPVAPVGPDGEALVVLALRQARAAGFDEVIVVVGPATEAAVADALRSEKVSHGVSMARQTVPPGRSHPLGTVDALLAAVASMTVSSPDGVVVANGDDLYGVDALTAAHQWITGAHSSDGAAVMFEVRRTLSSAGGVSRAVPVVADGLLVTLEEHRDVGLELGTIRTGSGRELRPETPVSMNLWCLRPTAIGALDELRARFVDTVTNQAEMGADAELGLPTAIDTLVRDGSRFEILRTTSTWHGVTWPDDVARVRAALMAEAATPGRP